LFEKKTLVPSKLCTETSERLLRCCMVDVPLNHNLIKMSFRRTSSDKLGENDSLLLDEDEQNRLTEELKNEAANQSNLQRKMFYFAFCAVAAIFLVCFIFSVLFPWEMNHQVHFKEQFPHYWFLMFYVGSMYSFGVAAAIVKVVLKR
jgi:hypothetical protein